MLVIFITVSAFIIFALLMDPTRGSRNDDEWDDSEKWKYERFVIKNLTIKLVKHKWKYSDDYQYVAYVWKKVFYESYESLIVTSFPGFYAVNGNKMTRNIKKALEDQAKEVKSNYDKLKALEKRKQDEKEFLALNLRNLNIKPMDKDLQKAVDDSKRLIEITEEAIKIRKRHKSFKF